MQSTAATVEAYLKELPADRRAAIGAVRDVILKSLNKDYDEGMYYGMIMYYLPHSIFPAGYHCDPTKPLGVVALASQKQYMSLYLDPAEHADWFHAQWAKAGKKLDMGKVCIRFKRVEDLALAVIAEFLRRMPPKKLVESYLAGRLAMSEGARSRKKKSLPAKTKRR
jgi:Domain of unknown function (DU1801)